jgi:hypothetical protein
MRVLPAIAASDALGCIVSRTDGLAELKTIGVTSPSNTLIYETSCITFIDGFTLLRYLPIEFSETHNLRTIICTSSAIKVQ